MKKKILSVVLCLCIVLTMLPGVARAETSGTFGKNNLTWVLDNGTLTISGSGDMPSYWTSSDDPPWYSLRNSVKKVVVDRGITWIGGKSFYDCSNLTEVSIANTVQCIDAIAFSKCTSLTSITIPNGVTGFGTGAFEGCTRLQSITIPSSVTTIQHSNVFRNCTSLKSVTILGNTMIGTGAFAGCTALENVSLGNTTSIESEAFSGCTSLTSITIPKSVSNIVSNAFVGCSKLSAINVDSNNAYYSSLNGVLFNKNQTRLVRYPENSGSSYTIPDSVVDIRAAFAYCSSLTNVTIPNSVTNIGSAAFSNCSGLTNITIPDSVTNIGNNAFYNCSGLTEITIPESVTTIDWYAFENCTNLETIIIPVSVTSIADSVFHACLNLTIHCYKNSYAHQYAQQFGIQFELLDDNSQPSVVSIQSVALTKNGMTTNLLTQTAEFELGSSEMAAVSANVNWDSENNGRTFLIQDRNTYVELPTSFTPGTVFNSDDPVYVIATNATADMLLDWKEIKLQIVQSIPPTAPQISITPETLQLSIGKTEDITVTTTPAGAEYTLTSSDPEVVSVSGTTLTANKLGWAEITAALVDHPGVTAVCSVTVKDGYDDLMCAIAACQLSYEDELIRYGFGATVETFADAAIGPDRTLWNGAVWDAPLSDFYKDVLGNWKIVNVVSEPSGLFAVALDNTERNQRIIAFRDTKANYIDIDINGLDLKVWNYIPSQFLDAVEFYKENIGTKHEILLTGHSFGGAAACYVSLLTGERAELFNAANGLIISNTYFICDEEVYQAFRGADRWNFTNHVTDSKNAVDQFIKGTVLRNELIAYPNADKLPVEIHVPAITATTGAVGKNSCHDPCSMLEYDRSTERFWLTQSTPYSQTMPAIRQLEMTRTDLLYILDGTVDVMKKPLWLEAIWQSINLFKYLVGEDYLNVSFNYGSSGDDDIVDKKIMEQAFLLGGDGNDFLTGGCINDVLVGGLGTNAMDGGPMNDLYVITGTSDQYINDCSGVDDIYIPSGVRVSSYGNPTDKVDGYYVLTLTNGQRIMINENRKQGSDNRFRVYSMDGTYCGSYQTVPQETEAQMMALTVEEETVETSETLPVTTLEFSGKNLVLNVQDSAGNTVGTVDTTSDPFPLYRPYGYFYYDSQDETMRAHLFGGTGEVQVSSTSQAEQIVECAYIFHAASDDLPLKRFTANIAVGSSDTILTPSCSVQEPAVPFRLMDGNGDIQNIPVKTEDLTVSETPSTPDQPTESPNQPGGSTDTPPSNSSGGGGSSSSNSYSISTPTRVTGGTIQVSPSSAQKGATVTITVTPNSGYELDRLTVTDSRGNEIKLTAQGGGKYTFTMPGRAVTVKAAFAPLPDDTEKPCDGGADCPSRGFTDLGTVGAWYHEAVDYVLRNNLMGGYGSGVFGPNDTLTRAQFAQILYNKVGRPAVTGGSIFTDVAPGAWYVPAITWAAERGIVGGYGNGMFGPDDNITREQLSVILWRYAGNPAATDKELHFTDADKASGYALEALRWAVENGVMGGYGNGQLAPQGLATRAQAAQMLKNYLER